MGIGEYLTQKGIAMKTSSGTHANERLRLGWVHIDDHIDIFLHVGADVAN